MKKASVESDRYKHDPTFFEEEYTGPAWKKAKIITIPISAIIRWLIKRLTKKR